ncbi:MAG: hypothetical protein LBE48_00640 [Methanomassiliicoccaceae archaeon]|jgi:hypothetical protein|nr:hypothetical protein [Methanomassiliicoccaceae archaeon]
MKKMVMVLTFCLLSASVLCILTPTASAAHVKETYNDAQLPDIYYLEVTATDKDYIILDDPDIPKYPLFYRQYNDEDKALFEEDLKNKNPVPRPSSTASTNGTYHVYVFMYEDPSKITVKTSSGFSKKLTANDLWKGSDAIKGFKLYSGQRVKVDLTSGMDIFLKSADDYLSKPNLKAGKMNEITATMQGEHRVYGNDYFDSKNGVYINEKVIFASFTIEYDDPPNTGAFGLVFLIMAAACMGSMVLFARPQKIK